jgi:trehalose/maltose hydrolase-like predicted phosphorylase
MSPSSAGVAVRADLFRLSLGVDGQVPLSAFTVHLESGRPVAIEKSVAVSTSRDSAISTAALEADKRIARAGRFAELLDMHRLVWGDLWRRFGIAMEVGFEQRLALNLHIFHVLQVVAAADADLDAGLPARGLHGEGYRGHIFWDEFYVYPLLTVRRPELTRCFLLYRYRRLPAARDLARANGFDGAMFPWQSGSDGRDETSTELLNLRNGQWMPDNSHRQRRVGLAVAYSVWQYYQATGDKGFLEDYGAEILIEVARLFAGMAVHDPVDDRFDISGVMGPDEYHDGYPDAPGQGLRNNAYTNVLAAWVLAHATETVDMLTRRDCAPLWHRLHFRPGELAHWDRVSRGLRVPFHEGVIGQFEGYESLLEFDWDGYRKRYGNIGRMDLILQAEGDTTNRYKLSKQADVLMLFYLFSAEELRGLFERLGYSLSGDTIRRTVKYYEARTTHGSTLSRVTHSWVLARTDRAHSWSLFKEALRPTSRTPRAERRVKAHPLRRHGGNRRHGAAVLRRCGNPGRRSSAASGVARRDRQGVVPDHLPGTAGRCRADAAARQASAVAVRGGPDQPLRRRHREYARPGPNVGSRASRELILVRTPFSASGSGSSDGLPCRDRYGA